MTISIQTQLSMFIHYQNYLSKLLLQSGSHQTLFFVYMENCTTDRCHLNPLIRIRFSPVVAHTSSFCLLDHRTVSMIDKSRLACSICKCHQNPLTHIKFLIGCQSTFLFWLNQMHVGPMLYIYQVVLGSMCIYRFLHKKIDLVCVRILRSYINLCCR
jgi:hypothetical protein